MNEFSSTHNLPFEVADWPLSPKWKVFRIGTITGLWGSTDTSYDILAIDNEDKGNGHLQDVFDWFKMKCIRDKRDLRFHELLNIRFENYLLRNGFEKGDNCVIMSYKKMK